MRDLVVRVRRRGTPDPAAGALIAAGATLGSMLILLVVGGGFLMGLTLLPGRGLGRLVFPSLSPFLAGCFLLAPAAGAEAGSWWAWEDWRAADDRPEGRRPDLVTGMAGASAASVVLAVIAASAAGRELNTPAWRIASAVVLVAGLGAALPWLVHRAPILRPVVAAGAAYLLASMVIDFLARTVLVPGLSGGQAGSVMRAARHAAHLAPWVRPTVALLAGAAGGWWGARQLPKADEGKWALAGVGPVAVSLGLLAAGCLAFGPGPVLHGRWPSMVDAVALLAGGLAAAWAGESVKRR